MAPVPLLSIILAALSLGCQAAHAQPAMSTAAMPAIGPTSRGAAREAVVLLHGYGANGADLAPLARQLSATLAEAVFLLPDGFEPMPGSPGGRQWFPLAGSDDAARLAGVRRVRARLVPWIDQELQRRHLTRARLAVGGFSQGAMIALDLGLHMSPSPAGVVVLSGRLVDDSAPSPSPASVLLVHGTADPRIPIAAANDAIARLGRLHVRTQPLLLPGVGHTIAPEAVAAARTFLQGLWR